MRLTIKIAQRHYLLYLPLPHHLKVVSLSPQLPQPARSDQPGVQRGDLLGRGRDGLRPDPSYAEAEQHEYPAQLLMSQVWAPEGYWHALEMGAVTGYFAIAIARRAETPLALGPGSDMRQLLEQR